MNSKIKIVVVGSLMILINVTLMLIFNMLVIGIMSLILIIGVMLDKWLKSNKKVKKTTPIQYNINSNSRAIDWDTNIENIITESYLCLLDNNHKLRLESNSIGQIQVEHFETLIDELRETLLLVDDNVSPKLRRKMGQMCIEFLPKLLNDFMLATSETRDIMLNDTVDNFKNEVESIQIVIKNDREVDYEFYVNVLGDIMKK